MFEITSDARIWFQIASWPVSNPASGCQAHTIESGHTVVTSWLCDVIRITTRTEPNAIGFLATLTDTDLNIQGIQVKCLTNGNCDIPATDSRLWGTKWYYLLSAQVCMLHHGAFRIFSTAIFNWMFKNCVSRRSSSKGYVLTTKLSTRLFKVLLVWILISLMVT